MRKFLTLLLVLFIFTACSSVKNEETQEINIYSARNYDVDKDLLLQFEEETGIKVNLFEGKGDELIEYIDALYSLTETKTEKRWNENFTVEQREWIEDAKAKFYKS